MKGLAVFAANQFKAAIAPNNTNIIKTSIPNTKASPFNKKPTILLGDFERNVRTSPIEDRNSAGMDP
jgi:hypothetical protein